MSIRINNNISLKKTLTFLEIEDSLLKFIWNNQENILEMDKLWVCEYFQT